MAKVKATLNELREVESVTPRLLAKVDGRIIAMVFPASLYSRPLFQAIRSETDMGRNLPKHGRS
jgi:hypothetical protein